MEHATNGARIGSFGKKTGKNSVMERQNEQPTTVSDGRFKEQLLCKLDELRKANFLCDTIVRVEGEDFPAHKNVLCATSDYFKAFFSSDLQVKESQSSLVGLKNMKSSTIAEVLRFMYTGEVNMSSSNAQDLIVVSDYLIIPRLKTTAAEFIGKSINASNCSTMESFAFQYNCDALSQAVLNYKCEHFLTYVKSNDFMHLDVEKVKELACLDDLHITKEEEVYEAVIEWVKHDLTSRECFLPDLLNCLRLFSLSKYSLEKFLKREELIVKSPVCSNILYNGLNFFVFPDRFLSKSLKHRSSIQNEEHVIVVIGSESDLEEDIKTDCYVLSTKQWKSLAPIPESCALDMYNLYVSAVCGGLLYRIDGVDGKVTCYNPLENAWRARTTKFFSSCRGCAVASFHEELYLFGGMIHEDNDLDTEVMFQDGFKYNPLSNAWTKVASMQTGRAYHCAVVVEDLIYVIGGCNGQISLKSVETYDASTNQWRRAPDMANPRKHGAAVNAGGKIFVTGGYCDNDETSVEPSCELFDPLVNQWSLLPGPCQPRCCFGIVSVDDMVYIFGGEDSEQWISTFESFDFRSNKWNGEAEKPLPMPRNGTRTQACLLKVPKKFIKNSTGRLSVS